DTIECAARGTRPGGAPHALAEGRSLGGCPEFDGGDKASTNLTRKIGIRVLVVGGLFKHPHLIAILRIDSAEVIQRWKVSRRIWCESSEERNVEPIHRRSARCCTSVERPPQFIGESERAGIGQAK